MHKMSSNCAEVCHCLWVPTSQSLYGQGDEGYAYSATGHKGSLWATHFPVVGVLQGVACFSCGTIDGGILQGGDDCDIQGRIFSLNPVFEVDVGQAGFRVWEQIAALPCWVEVSGLCRLKNLVSESVVARDDVTIFVVGKGVVVGSIAGNTVPRVWEVGDA
jgi:hypothetical protein